MLRQLQPASTFLSEVMRLCGNPHGKPPTFISQPVPVVRSRAAAEANALRRSRAIYDGPARGLPIYMTMQLAKPTEDFWPACLSR